MKNSVYSVFTCDSRYCYSTS